MRPIELITMLGVLGCSATFCAEATSGRDSFLKSLREHCEAREGAAHAALSEEQEIQKDLMISLPTTKPICGPQSQRFGRVKSKKDGHIEHLGIDIRTKAGKKVVAAGAGKVLSVGCAKSEAQGKRHDDCNQIVVTHGNGLITIYSGYAKALAKPSQIVCRDEAVAESAEGDLHFEVRVNDVPVDPMTYILETF